MIVRFYAREKREKNKMESEVFISIHLHKPPIGFYSSCLFIMNCDGLYCKAAAVRGGFQGLCFFSYVWEQQGRKAGTRDFIHAYGCVVPIQSTHGLDCLHANAPVHMEMNNWTQYSQNRLHLLQDSPRSSDFICLQSSRWKQMTNKSSTVHLSTWTVRQHDPRTQ